MKRRVSLICLLLLTFLFGATRTDLRYDLLHYGVSPRVQALGNTGVISSQGPESHFYNPAVSIVYRDRTFLLSSNPYYYDNLYLYAISQFYISSNRSMFGIGYLSNTISNVEYRQNRSDSASLTSVQQQGLILSMARQVNRSLSVGFVLTLLADNYSTIENGLIYTISAYSTYYDPIRIGFAFKNYTENEKAIDIGFSTPLLFDSLTFYAAATAYLNTSAMFHYLAAGCSYRLLPNLELQAGINHENIGAGVSMTINGFRIEYSMQFTDVGNLMNIAVSL